MRNELWFVKRFGCASFGLHTCRTRRAVTAAQQVGNIGECHTRPPRCAQKFIAFREGFQHRDQPRERVAFHVLSGAYFHLGVRRIPHVCNA